jgi:hypothetical protein
MRLPPIKKLQHMSSSIRDTDGTGGDLPLPGVSRAEGSQDIPLGTGSNDAAKVDNASALFEHDFEKILERPSQKQSTAKMFHQKRQLFMPAAHRRSTPVFNRQVSAAMAGGMWKRRAASMKSMRMSPADSNKTEEVGEATRQRALQDLLLFLITTAANVFAVFGIDGWQMINPSRSREDVLYTIVLIVFIIFALEFFLQLAMWPGHTPPPPLLSPHPPPPPVGYRKSFFVFVDLFSTFSLIVDFLPLFNVVVFRDSTSVALRFARAARAGARFAK